MVSISFMLASGLRYLWMISLEMQEAPEVAKVSVQDMEAAANPIAREGREKHRRHAIHL